MSKGSGGEAAASPHGDDGKACQAGFADKSRGEDDTGCYQGLEGRGPVFRAEFRKECRQEACHSDKDGGVASPRSILDRLDSPPPSPPWADQPHEYSDGQREFAHVDGAVVMNSTDLPTPPPPILTSPAGPKKSPYSSELCTAYAPFYPDAVEAPGLGDRCKSYTSLSALASTPVKGLRRIKSSVDCRLLPPRPRPGVRPLFQHPAHPRRFFLFLTLPGLGFASHPLQPPGPPRSHSIPHILSLIFC
jgi:hypothetical protein